MDELVQGDEKRIPTILVDYKTLLNVILTILKLTFPTALCAIVADYGEEHCWWCKTLKCLGHLRDDTTPVACTPADLSMRSGSFSLLKSTNELHDFSVRSKKVRLQLQSYFYFFTDWNHKEKRVFERFGHDLHLRQKAQGNAFEMWCACDPSNLYLMGGVHNSDLDLLVRGIYSWLDYATFKKMFCTNENTAKQEWERARFDFLLWLNTLDDAKLSECVSWYNKKMSK